MEVISELTNLITQLTSPGDVGPELFRWNDRANELLRHLPASFLGNRFMKDRWWTWIMDDGIEYRCYLLFFWGILLFFGGFCCDRHRMNESGCKILFVVSLASESDLSWPDWQKEPRHWHRHRITWKAGYLNQPWDEGIIISKILSSMISILPGNPYNNFCTRK